MLTVAFALEFPKNREGHYCCARDLASKFSYNFAICNADATRKWKSAI